MYTTEKVEKVVNAPQKPVPTNKDTFEDTCLPTTAPNIVDPIILITPVLQGVNPFFCENLVI